jgi:chromosomal replication initiation ATPase DnaA
LGDGEFVENVLKSAEEAFEERSLLEAKGYDFNRVVERVAEVMSIGTEKVTASGKSPQTVKARSLLCFWAHRKLGMTTTEIGKKLSLCQSAVSRSSMRGERIAGENRFELLEEKSIKSWTSP